MSANSIDPNTPVLVGVGVIQQREDQPEKALQPHQLMIEAVKSAAQDAGSDRLLTEAGRIYVPRGMWAYSDPARLIAEAVGAQSATSVMAEIGILQQTLFADACERILAGEHDIAIVAGGEAKYRQLQATIQGIELNDDVPSDNPADVTLTPEAELWSEHESAAGLAMPVGFYALMESALRYARGQSVEEHRDLLATMYENFSKVAVDNPHAWNRKLMTAEEIRNPSPKNKMLAFPYTKFHNTQWNVDQAAGLILCSVAKAEALGISRDKWIFPLASTESNHMVNTSERKEIHRCPGAEIAGKRALELADVTVSAIDLIDMYSCFPAAVQIYAEPLGIPLDGPLTVTGGMTFGGGPLNNYILQSTCRMAELLREKGQGTGLVSCVSGMLTKQGFGIWSTEPNPNGFQSEDVTKQTAKVETANMVADYSGDGQIVAFTVLFEGSEPSRAVVVCDLPSGQRTIVYNEDTALMERMQKEEFCGVAVTIGEGQFVLA